MQILQQGMRARKDMFISMYRIGNFPRKNSKPPGKEYSEVIAFSLNVSYLMRGRALEWESLKNPRISREKIPRNDHVTGHHPAESGTALSSHASCMLQTNIHTHSCIPDRQPQHCAVAAEAEQYWQTLRPSIIKPCLLGMFCTRGLAAYTVLVPGLSIECNGRWKIREMNLCWWAWIDHDQNAKCVRVLLCIA